MANGNVNGEDLGDGGRGGRGSRGRGRGRADCAALREAMRGALRNKAAALPASSSSSPAAAISETARAVAAASPLPPATSQPLQAEADTEDDEIDPWPEVPLSFTTLGIEDGKSRAAEIRRRGDFEGSARMWAKVCFVGRRCIAVGRPSQAAQVDLAALAVGRAEAQLVAEDWAGAVASCSRALKAPYTVCNPAAVKLLCARARARAELGDAEDARADMSEAIARELDGMDDGLEGVQEEARALDARLKELEEKRQAEKQAELATAVFASKDAGAGNAGEVSSAAADVRGRSGWGADRASATSVSARDATGRDDGTIRSKAFADKSSQRGVSSSSSSSAPARGSTVDANQAFFDQMQKGYVEMCLSDGWEDIRRLQDEMQRESSRSKPKDNIPKDSDYFKVKVPAEAAHRELRPTDKTAEYRASFRSISPKPRREFHELRRVEAATREAVEREKQRSAEAKAASRGDGANDNKKRHEVVRIDNIDAEAESDEETRFEKKQEAEERGLMEIAEDSFHLGQQGRPSIITKSDVVRIDNIDEEAKTSDDEDPQKAAKEMKARAAADALKEFDRLGREKEERLAKWRDRWG
eukprot:TRINITY_DN22092_c0_g1_i3.p1 TRINITY_DN22092_c0_g1~~TRINITY_DN22092_c0_g1_i3.p1  ORF type:complete len:624 (+),score=152.49 TRINITY_DN22092_c0_g1_i3:113-1873(+)